MEKVSIFKLLYYVSIIIGFRFNIILRKRINKYTLQDLFKLNTVKANRIKHMNDVIEALGRVFATFFGDFVFGSYKTILFIIPFSIIASLINISSIFMPESQRGLWYNLSFSLNSSTTFAHVVLIIPFIKYQLTDALVFDKFFNIYYWILNIFHASASFFQTIIFKTIKNNGGIQKNNILWFWLPPFIITFIFYIIFYIKRNYYKKKEFKRKDFIKYFTDFISIDKKLSLFENQLKSIKLNIIFSVIAMKIMWHVVEDQFDTCLTDFADSASGFNIPFFGKNWVVSGSTLDTLNPLTVVIFSPILIHIIYPYLLNQWNDFRKLLMGLFIAQLGLLFGAFLHVTNIQKNCIDRSNVRSLLWHGICVILGALSELIIYPIYIKTVSFNTPIGYENLCMCMALSVNAGGGLICFLMNLTPLKETIKLCILVCLSTLGSLAVFIGYLNNKKCLNKIKELSKKEITF